MAERKTVLVRLRPALYAALRRWAADDFRSVNGQLEYIVQQALRDVGRLPGAAETAGGDPDTGTDAGTEGGLADETP